MATRSKTKTAYRHEHADKRPHATAKYIRIEFLTPTAFKSRGQYLNLPTTRLVLQSLIRKWNGSVTECPIEDEDGEEFYEEYPYECMEFEDSPLYET